MRRFWFVNGCFIDNEYLLLLNKILSTKKAIVESINI